MTYLRTLVTITLAFTLILFSNQSHAGFTPLLELNISDQTPVRGQTVTFEIKKHQYGQRLNPGDPVGIFMGGMPNGDGRLGRPLVRVANGVIGPNRKFTTEIAVPNNIAIGAEKYFRAYAITNGEIIKSEMHGTTVIPDIQTDADFIVRPNSYTNLATGQTVNASFSIRDAYNAAPPGSVMVLEDGLYEPFQLVGQNDNCRSNARKWIIARNEHRAVVDKLSWSGSPTIYLGNICNTTFIDMYVKITVDHAGIFISDAYSPAHSIHFLNMNVNGEWDAITNTGPQAKWGYFGWNSTDLLIRGGFIGNIPKEHAIYMHAMQKGSNGYAMRVEDVVSKHIGRTFLQAVARNIENTGLPARGTVLLLNNYIEDHGLEFFAGATGIHLAGNHVEGKYILENHVQIQGFNDQINARAGNGHVHGVGHMALKCYGDSGHVPNPEVHLRHSAFLTAPGGGDRDTLIVDCTQKFVFKNNFIDADRKMFVSPYMNNSTAIFDQNQNNNDIRIEVLWNNVWRDYEDFLNVFY